RIVADGAQLVGAKPQLTDGRVQSLRRRRHIGAEYNLHMFAESVGWRVEIVDGKTHAESRHKRDDAPGSANCPDEPSPCSPAAAAKSGGLFETLTKQLRHTIRLARLRRCTGQCWTLHCRGPQMQIESAKRRRRGFLLASRQKTAEPRI